MWITPVQAVVLPITDSHREYAAQVAARLKQSRIRVELDDRNEKVGKKIRDTELASWSSFYG